MSSKTPVQNPINYKNPQIDKGKVKRKKDVPVNPSVTQFSRIQCYVCKRKFVPDRLDIHVAICEKVSSKKRPIFDSRKHRLKDTPLQPYLPVILKRLKEPKMQYTQWRQKHEEFIQAMREGRKVQSYINRGYNLSKLPPSTPSVNAHYIQCCYCLRRFAPTVAERHIPKCQYIECNKSHPKVQKPTSYSSSSGLYISKYQEKFEKRRPSSSKQQTQKRNDAPSKKTRPYKFSCKYLSEYCKRLCENKSRESAKKLKDSGDCASPGILKHEERESEDSETVIYRDIDYFPIPDIDPNTDHQICRQTTGVEHYSIYTRELQWKDDSTTLEKIGKNPCSAQATNKKHLDTNDESVCEDDVIKHSQFEHVLSQKYVSPQLVSRKREMNLETDFSSSVTEQHLSKETNLDKHRWRTQNSKFETYQEKVSKKKYSSKNQRKYDSPSRTTTDFEYSSGPLNYKEIGRINAEGYLPLPTIYKF